MGTKNEPGQYDCYGNAADDEPIFTLRAKDPIAPDLIRMWAVEYRRTKRPWTEKCDAKYAEAMLCAERMERWRRKNN